MICYVLATGKQHLGPHVVVGYGIKIFGRAFSLRHQITLTLFAFQTVLEPSTIHVNTRLFSSCLLGLESAKPLRGEGYKHKVEQGFGLPLNPT